MRILSTHLFIIATLLASVLPGSALLAQGTVFCGITDPSSPSTQLGGQHITASGTLRVLFVFVNILGDTTDASNANWPYGSAPTFMNTVVDSTTTQNSTSLNNITYYFRDMSFGAFTMIGNAVYIQTSDSLAKYLRENKSRYDINRQILAKLDSTFDFAPYDNWRKDSAFAHTNVPDSLVDMIQMCFRTIPLKADGTRLFGNFTGEASLGYGSGNPVLQVDGGVRKIRFGYSTGGSGVTCLGQKDYPNSLFLTKHEFGHWLGLPHQADYGVWSIMGGLEGNVGPLMNSYERERVAWMSFSDVPAASITTQTLSDFATTGQAARVALPGTTPQEYLLIENHQGLSPFDLPDQTGAKGIYVINQPIDWPSTDNGYALRVVTADGRWNWSNPYWVDNPYSSNPGDSLPVHQRGIVNRATGLSDRDKVPNTKGPSGRIYFWLDEVSGQQIQSTRFKGDGRDRFDTTDNNLLSRWSNPATTSWNGTLKDIAIEIQSQSGDNIALKFYTTTPDQAMPAKPQYLRAPSVASGSTSLSWDLNLETDTAGYNVYRGVVWDGSGEPVYTKINSSPVHGSTYIDNSYESLPGIFAQNKDLYHRYRIRALDSQGKESIKSDHVDAYFTHLANGTISTNRTWQIDVRIIGNTTVSAGKTVTILPGTVIKTDNSLLLTVNGKLIANGTSTNRISFTSSSGSPTAGSWNGILLNGGGPDTLKYCKVDYAVTGLSVVNTTGTSLLDHDTISNSSEYGLSISNTQTSTSTLKLNYSRLRKNAKHGLLVGTARVDLLQSRVDSNGLAALWDAIYVGAGAKLYMKHSRVNNNGGYGIRVTGSGSYAYINPDGIAAGNNTLNENGYGELYVRDSAGAFIGDRVTYQQCSCGEETIAIGPIDLPTISTPDECTAQGCYWETVTIDHGGFNNIYNSFSFSGRFVNNAATPTVKAQLTYWGSSSAPPSGAFIGNVDRANHLSSQQSTLGWSIPIAFEEEAVEDGPYEDVGGLLPKKGEDLSQLSGQVYSQETNGRRMKSWIYHLLTLLKDNPEAAGPDAIHFLYDLIGPKGRFGQDRDFNWDELIAESASPAGSPSIRKLSSTYRIQSLMDQGDFNGAIGMIDQELDHNPTDGLWLAANVRKIVSLAALGNLTEASQLYRNIFERAATIDETTIGHIGELLAIGPAIVPAEAGRQDREITEGVGLAVGKPERYSLRQNYPNPFNPVTEISYNLPEGGHVSIVVYDLLGQVVLTLMDGYQAAGPKSISVDLGSLPSGVYFYRMQARGFNDLKKMVLMK